MGKVVKGILVWILWIAIMIIGLSSNPLPDLNSSYTANDDYGYN